MDKTKEKTERNIRLIIAYDGTELHGYQRQDNAYTVQEAMEEALSKVCNESITVYGLSRTDAGVHARCQVITFYTSGRIPVENLKRALIAHLPPYIVVRHAEEIPLTWRPRWDTFGKKYTYTILNGEVEDPLTMRYHWYIKKPLNVEAMREAATYLEGQHDFSSFQGMNSTPQDPVKTMYMVHIDVAGTYEKGRTITIHIGGDGFLYHMVRNMAGFLVDVGLGKYAPHVVPDILAKKDRRFIGKTAPAQGLCLDEVYFSKAAISQK